MRSIEKNKKMSVMEIIFTVLSITFLLLSICFYSYRMIHYKNKYSPKVSDGKLITLLSDKIKENIVSNGEGLYNEENNFIFKGKNVNNYIIYSNMLYRIIKVNKDNTIEIILEDSLNYMKYDNKNINYNISDINSYLNDVFYKNIQSDLLIKSPYCIDTITDINKITCNNIESDYVKLLSISDYLNSKINNQSYLTDNNIIWLNNNNGNKVWLLNNENLSLSDSNSIYKVKPIITLNNLTEYLSGEGTYESPFIINDNKTYYASYIKLDNDIYRVYDINNDILKLKLDNIYMNGNIKYNFSNKNNLFSLKEGIGNYINTTIFNNLSYKDLLEDCETYIGEYNNSYKDIFKEKVISKISINNILDPIFNTSNNNYFLSTPNDNNIYIYNENVYSVKPNIVRNINYSICINSNNITTGKGTYNEPYIIRSEVVK